jgi:hypothetical protein
MSPYRQQPHVLDPTANADAEKAVGCPDGELMPIFCVFWVASIARVALGVVHHETFGAQGSVAFLAVLAIPYLLRDAIVWWLRRLWHVLTIPRGKRPPSLVGPCSASSTFGAARSRWSRRSPITDAPLARSSPHHPLTGNTNHFAPAPCVRNCSGAAGAGAAGAASARTTTVAGSDNNAGANAAACGAGSRRVARFQLPAAHRHK